jgi:hypothetical protein
MAPLFESLLATVVRSGEDRRVTVVTSIGDPSPDGSGDLDWKALPDSWHIQVVDDDDAFLVAARGATDHSDELVLIAAWGATSRGFGTLERAMDTWHLPEIAVCEVAPDLPTGGRVGMVVPAVALVSDASREARAAIMASAYPDVIVEMDARDVRGVDLGESQNASNGRAAIVMYERRSPGGPVRFATVPADDDCDEAAVVADLERLRDLQGGRTIVGFVTRDTIRPGDPLNPGYHSPETDQHRQAIGQYGAVVPLAHVFTLHDSGDEVSRGDLVVTCAGQPPAGRLELEELPPEGAAVQPGAVLLRPSRPLEEHERTFIVAYLRSDRAWRLYAAQGGTPQVDSETLGRLPVVLPTEPVRLTLAEIEDARALLRRWDGELTDAKERLLDIDTAGGGVSDVLGLGRRVRHRVAAGARVDDLGYRVRTQFPWPLAVLWRVVEAAQPDADGYMRTLEFAEAMACYLACLAITAAREAGISLAALQSTAARLSGATRGLSFADWTGILSEVRGRAFRARIGDHNPFPEISELMSPDDDVDRALRRLKERRDALAHNRGPRTPGELREEHQQAVVDLSRWVEACEFVSSYPIWRIEATHWDEMRGKNGVDYRNLMGDNELTPLRTVELDQPTVEAESLYATSQDGALHLLRPVLTWRECEQCHRPAVMVLDQYSATDGSLVVRSLDHGHTAQADELIDAFKEVGLVEGAAE